MCTSRPVRSTRRAVSPAAPPRQTWTPLIATSSRSGSKAAPVVPIAASTRPQFGSLPNSAHLSRLLRAIDAADLDGVVLGGRADDLDARPPWWRPRRRRAAGAARSAHTARAAAAKLVGVGRDAGRAAGQQQHGVVGGHAAVGVDAVEGAPAWPRAAPRRASAASTTASVVITHSIVASPGASMPAPLAMPPTVQPSRPVRRPAWRRCRWCGSPRPRRRRRRRPARRPRASTPASRPVHRQPLADQPGGADRDLAGADAAARPRRARRCGGCRRSPSGPVQALAPPELRTTARSRPSASDLLRPQHRRGLDPVAR